jgi:hypothetical protein
MMKTSKIALMAGVAAGLLASGPTWAGAKLKIDDDSYIDFGARVQTLIIQQEVTGNDATDNSWQDQTDFKVRRARLRVNMVVNDKISAFIQTETGGGAGSGEDMRIIDAYTLFKYNNWLQLFSGEHMAPSGRQETTSSGGLMAIDRPGITYKNLTWNLRSVDRFANGTIPGTSDSQGAPDAVRDVGATIFGSGSFNDTTHLKYYVGAYDGVQNATTGDGNKLRYTARAQLNLFDAEAGYFNLSTYLGKKKTIGFGVSYDTQDEIQDKGTSTGDYTQYELDAFIDWPVGPGYLTAEAAYRDLDLDKATAAAAQAQGNGWFAQAGYYINKWQPWVEYETWDGDGAGGVGNYDLYRLGVSYFFKGHNANIKFGYEYADLDYDYTGTTESDRSTFVVGFYTTY